MWCRCQCQGFAVPYSGFIPFLFLFSIALHHFVIFVFFFLFFNFPLWLLADSKTFVATSHHSRDFTSWQWTMNINDVFIRLISYCHCLGECIASRYQCDQNKGNRTTKMNIMKFIFSFCSVEFDQVENGKYFVHFVALWTTTHKRQWKRRASPKQKKNCFILLSCYGMAFKLLSVHCSASAITVYVYIVYIHNFLYFKTLHDIRWISFASFDLFLCLTLQSWFVIVVFSFCIKFENPLKAFSFRCEYFNRFCTIEWCWMVWCDFLSFFICHLFVVSSCFHSAFTPLPLPSYTLLMQMFHLSNCHIGASSDNNMLTGHRLSFHCVCLLSWNRDQIQSK